jgi:hypothetical protein
MNWVLPEILKNRVDSFFFETMWYEWRLVKFLEFKKDEILAGLSKAAVHHLYKKNLQLILESDLPEDISIVITKQLTQKILESDKVKMFWRAISAEKKYMEQLTAIRASALFESVSLLAYIFL